MARNYPKNAVVIDGAVVSDDASHGNLKGVLQSLRHLQHRDFCNSLIVVDLSRQYLRDFCGEFTVREALEKLNIERFAIIPAQ
jgi:hypothetical protein